MRDPTVQRRPGFMTRSLGLTVILVALAGPPDVRANEIPCGPDCNCGFIWCLSDCPGPVHGEQYCQSYCEEQDCRYDQWSYQCTPWSATCQPQDPNLAFQTCTCLPQ